jgi:FixJ family two-component response regulator
MTLGASTRFTVAVVDDDARILESLADLLESVGHDVRCYSSARTLCDQDGLSDIDCLICDVGMPDMDGLELRRRALAARPDLPVFLISGRADMRALSSAMSERDRYFDKPFDAPALLAAVDTALAASRRTQPD